MSFTSEYDNNSAAATGRLFSLASWLRPSSYWTVVVYHLPLALFSAAALVLPHLTSLKKLPLIPCTFLHLTGYPCPLCGFTRSFWAISTGHWDAAFTNSPLSFAVYLTVWMVFLFNGGALLSGVVLSRGPALRLGAGYRRKAVTAILTLLTANWIYRISMGFDVV